jgi:hypothetical protein
MRIVLADRRARDRAAAVVAIVVSAPGAAPGDAETYRDVLE